MITTMRDKYLLYIDVLGFRDLVRSDLTRVYDLYRVVANLNVHRLRNKTELHEELL